MSIPVNINGVIIPYPQTGDIGWGSDATRFAEEVASVLGKIGQSQAPVNDDIIVSPGNLIVDGVIYADDNTTANTPVISFTGDTNTGIGRSAADTLDFITNGNSRFRIEPTGQIKAVYESQVGTDYNTTLNNGYLCRAWVNFDGSTVVSPASATGIRGSGNVSTILDGGFGQYTINFTIPMPDNNYAVCVGGSNSSGNSFVPAVRAISAWASSAGSCRYTYYRTDVNSFDADQTLAHVAVFR